MNSENPRGTDESSPRAVGDNASVCYTGDTNVRPHSVSANHPLRLESCEKIQVPPVAAPAIFFWDA